ncbi:MAG: class I SAM-dependent methyltransferase [Calothrix sp. FI2-JRJ7]|jgi:ubiquinone/menaquinone biosynthesis C-methylase UbiE|nr:class I SAM-dependent methyltransferase [Calothrix sp. FI2-JRJ7]
MLQNTWNASLYEGKHAFVWQYGEDLLNLLSPQQGEKILDVGCGTGQLAAKIADTGAIVTGIDASAAMVEKAKLNYPNLEFAVADARLLEFDTEFDAVFSNATLHWIPEAVDVINSIHRALKPGGRFVAEFGGKGNVKLITDALYQALENKSPSPWYFPSIGEYTALLEKHGFDVSYAVLFDRPTPLPDGEAGLRNWLMMFASRFFANSTQQEVIKTVEEQLKPILYKNGTWTADYRRLRIIAMRES